MKPFVTLTDFESVLPLIQMDQADLLDLSAQAHQRVLSEGEKSRDEIATLTKRYGVKPKQIAQRRFENIHIAADQKDIYERTQFFGIRAREVMNKFYPLSSSPPDHLIHVTCTGYISPSPAQHLVHDNGWSDKTNITHAYHMGCYAALPAIRLAEGLAASKNHRVDIVHTEMCGLHLDSHDHSPEALVVQSLFADGHIKYSAVSDANGPKGFRVLTVCEKILPDSAGDMSWMPASWGMKMTLSRNVPSKISSNLKGFLEKMLRQGPFSLGDVLKNAVFAVHPGGPKIIDVVRETLELSEEQIQTSREILQSRGNMSSATLPHVWQKILQQKTAERKLVVSLAFGPGLTVFGSLFETV
ncbi:MAG: 3-oxoacyl-[acyl-carrier-protein] synthase III C-terminal domain-containing protein [Pseudobdellovibrionaceae bacterium]